MLVGTTVLLSNLVVFTFSATTPSPTTPPTTPQPPTPNKFHSIYGSTQHRQDKILKVKPLSTFEGVTAVQCLSLCLRHSKGKGSKTCKAYNYGNGTCSLLNTFVCEGDHTLTDAPGFSYYDLVKDHSDEVEYALSNQCKRKGRCTNRCLKFKLNKTPLSWQEAHNACRSDQALLAMPRNLKDHETLVQMMKKFNLLQSWIGLKKRQGVFYYDDGLPFDSEVFHAWGPDQPNDSGGTQQCVQIMSEMDYMWNDFDCSRPVGYVCQYVW